MPKSNVRLASPSSVATSTTSSPSFDVDLAVVMMARPWATEADDELQAAIESALDGLKMAGDDVDFVPMPAVIEDRLPDAFAVATVLDASALQPQVSRVESLSELVPMIEDAATLTMIDADFVPAIPIPTPSVLSDISQLTLVPVADLEEPPPAFAEGSQPNITISSFSPDEERFFAAGEELSAQHAREADELARRTATATAKQSWWKRLRRRSDELAFD